jgi:hypothetical protein
MAAFLHFLRFKAGKYERPHSKTLEVPALAGTKGQIALHFKALKCYESFNHEVKEGPPTFPSNSFTFA